MNPLQSRPSQYHVSHRPIAPYSPLGSNVDDQDDLPFELLEVILLATGELGLEIVELGHSPGEIWTGNEKLAAGVKMGRQ